MREASINTMAWAKMPAQKGFTASTQLHQQSQLLLWSRLSHVLHQKRGITAI
jgi:hypothetical protein